jgi:hypothetical protein
MKDGEIERRLRFFGHKWCQGDKSGYFSGKRRNRGLGDVRLCDRVYGSVRGIGGLPLRHEGTKEHDIISPQRRGAREGTMSLCV